MQRGRARVVRQGVSAPLPGGELLLKLDRDVRAGHDAAAQHVKDGGFVFFGDDGPVKEPFMIPADGGRPAKQGRWRGDHAGSPVGMNCKRQALCEGSVIVTSSPSGAAVTSPNGSVLRRAAWCS